MGSITYVKLFADTSGAVDLLSDAEAGRLFKAILHGIAGVEDELPGQEKLVYAMLKAQFERDAEAYDRFSDRQRENGKKGGRPKKPIGFLENPENPLVISENPNNPRVFSENPENPEKSGFSAKSQENPEKPNKDKDEDKDEDKENISSVSGNPNVDTVEAYAANNLTYLSPGNMQELEDFKKDLPEDLIRYAIDQACAKNARIWAYVRSILNSYVTREIGSVAEAVAAKEAKEKQRQQAPPAVDENPLLNATWFR